MVAERVVAAEAAVAKGGEAQEAASQEGAAAAVAPAEECWGAVVACGGHWRADLAKEAAKSESVAAATEEVRSVEANRAAG